jgi:hypothetical protein
MGRCRFQINNAPRNYEAVKTTLIIYCVSP